MQIWGTQLSPQHFPSPEATGHVPGSPQAFRPRVRSLTRVPTEDGSRLSFHPNGHHRGEGQLWASIVSRSLWEGCAWAPAGDEPAAVTRLLAPGSTWTPQGSGGGRAVASSTCPTSHSWAPHLFLGQPLEKPPRPQERVDAGRGPISGGKGTAAGPRWWPCAALVLSHRVPGERLCPRALHATGLRPTGGEAPRATGRWLGARERPLVAHKEALAGGQRARPHPLTEEVRASKRKDPPGPNADDKDSPRCSALPTGLSPGWLCAGGRGMSDI